MSGGSLVCGECEMHREVVAGQVVRSVSDLYSTDEVELLLEEIRGLEKAPAELQDFEIAGSQSGGLAHNIGSVHSWDSHPHYRRTPPLPPARIAPVYCDMHHLCTYQGFLRFIITLCSLSSVCLEYGAGGSELWLLPHADRLRLLLATALFTFMSSAALLFLDISRLVQIFPFNWAKLNAWVYISVGVMYLIAGSINLASVTGDDYWWVSAHATNMLIASSSLGVISGVLCGITALIYCYRRPPPNSDSALLGNTPSPSPTPPHSPLSVPQGPRGYAPVPMEPEPVPCSSKTPL